MSLLAWLFGKKEQTAAPKAEPPATPPERPAPPSEADNLRRWRESSRPRAWVEAHRGQWDHAQWLALLEELKRSPYWPMQPDAVGLVLEAAKRDWLRRN